MPKFTQINDKTNLVTLKSQLTLIESGISKQKSKNILLGNNFDLNLLDDALIDKKNEQLFSKILDFPINSTSSNEKKLGNWAKISSYNYIFYLKDNTVLFSFEDGDFVCKSEESICLEIK